MKKRIALVTVIVTLLLSCFAVTVHAEPAKMAPVPEVTARNVIMINTNTGAVVYEKSADEKIFPASLTKMVTLLVAADLINDYEQSITVSDDCYDDLVIGSSNINLRDGEVIKIDDLMYAIAISSANEATNALAMHLCGSVSDFVSKMNTKVAKLGAVNTHFVNTHGLHDTEHYTTAKDMSVIAAAAFSHERVSKYLSSSVHVIEPTNKTLNKRTLVTTNNLLRQNSGIYYKYCRAGKTGTTTAAGYNLVSIAEKGDTEFLLVAMNVEKVSGGTNTVFADSKALYDWGFSNYKNAKILEETEIITEVEVKLSAKGDHLVLLPEKNLYSVIPIDMDISSIDREITTEQEIFAPITQGDVLGKMVLKKDGVVYAETNLVAGDDVKRSTVLYYLYLIEMFFKNIWVRIICAVLILFIIIYIILVIRQNNRRKRKKLRRYVKF